MKVLITDKCHDRAKEILSEIAEVDVLPTMSEDEYVENINKYDAVMIRSTSRITKRIYEQICKRNNIRRNIIRNFT